MSDEAFDELSKSLTETVSRRQTLKLFGATAVGGVLAAIGGRSAYADDPGRCKRAGQNCRRSSECCSGICGANGQCLCPPPKVPDQQGRCVCPPDTFTCGQTEFAQCCPTGTDCCVRAGALDGFCCPPASHCSTCEADGFSFLTCCPNGTECQCNPFTGCRCV